MLKPFYNEIWASIDLGYESQKKYAISNFGRLVSYADTLENGTILKGCTTEGYPILKYHVYIDGKPKGRHLLFHKMVADSFLIKPTDEHSCIIHLDFDKTNNRVENLKFVTKTEMIAHHRNSPLVIQAKKNRMKQGANMLNAKLSITQVMRIKKRISDPNRKTRLKLIAKEFGISEMQLYRIKTGENWGQITV